MWSLSFIFDFLFSLFCSSYSCRLLIEMRARLWATNANGISPSRSHRLSVFQIKLNLIKRRHGRGTEQTHFNSTTNIVFSFPSTSSLIYTFFLSLISLKVITTNCRIPFNASLKNDIEKIFEFNLDDRPRRLTTISFAAHAWFFVFFSLDLLQLKMDANRPNHIVTWFEHKKYVKKELKKTCAHTHRTGE